MWDLPGTGLEPTSPALAGGFLTTVPPGKSLCTFFNWIVFVLICMSSLCITIIRHIICKYFLPFHRLPFLLFMVFFVVQKLFSLMWSHLFIFAFVAFAFGVRFKKSLPRPTSRSLLPRIFFLEFYGFRSYVQIFNPF